MDRIHRMSRGRKTLLSLLLVGALGTVAGIGTFSAFSATTVNAGNVFDAGTVSISDNDAGAAMYTIANATPGTPVVRCITVTYTGSLPANVHLYGSAVGAIGPFVNLSIDKGTGTSPFPNLHELHARTRARTSSRGRSAASPRRTPTSRPARRRSRACRPRGTRTTSVVYRFTLTLQNNSAAIGLTSGLHSFTWEAQNQ